MIYNVIDLFAGAGGLSLGFKQTGQVKIVAAAENNLNARKTYKRNFKLARLYSDVRTIDYAELQDTVGPVDIVIGGPPCQGFSNANRQHTTVISMNNRLVKEYVRAICELNPKAFVMENVAMLRSQVHRFFLEEQDLDNERIMAILRFQYRSQTALTVLLIELCTIACQSSHFVPESVKLSVLPKHIQGQAQQ